MGKHHPPITPEAAVTIGGGCTLDPDLDNDAEAITGGPTANTPEQGANLTTYSTTRLHVPPYLQAECFTVTAAIPNGGTAADQRAIIDASLFDKKTALQLSLINGGTVIPGVGGVEWLQGKEAAPKADTRQTTCFATKWNNTGNPAGQTILVGCTASYLHASVSDTAAIEATQAVVNALIGCITMPPL